MQDLRAKLKGLCDWRRWTASEAARAAKIPQQTLQNAMDGHEMRVGAAIRLARIMGVSVEWLFDDEHGFGTLSTPPFWAEPGKLGRDELEARKELEKGLERAALAERAVGVAPRTSQLTRRRQTVKTSANPEGRRKSSAGRD